MTASSPLAHTLRIMDELDAQPRPSPEAVVRQCYQDQGLDLDEDALAQAVKAVETQPKKEERVLDAPVQGPSSARIVRNVTLGLVISLGALVALSVGFSGPSAPPSAADMAGDVRHVVANATTEEFSSWLKEKKMGRAVLAAGDVLVVDREGHPEMRWSNVSQEVCHAMVQDIWESPSTRGIAASVDGKSTGFSCQGPKHLIVLTPHL